MDNAVDSIGCSNFIWKQGGVDAQSPHKQIWTQKTPNPYQGDDLKFFIPMCFLNDLSDKQLGPRLRNDKRRWIKSVQYRHTKLSNQSIIRGLEQNKW